jgi:hypothetical protein
MAAPRREDAFSEGAFRRNQNPQGVRKANEAESSRCRARPAFLSRCLRDYAGSAQEIHPCTRFCAESASSSRLHCEGKFVQDTEKLSAKRQCHQPSLHTWLSWFALQHRLVLPRRPCRPNLSSMRNTRLASSQYREKRFLDLPAAAESLLTEFLERARKRAGASASLNSIYGCNQR